MPLGEEIYKAAAEEPTDLVLLPWAENGLAFGEDLRQILGEPPCDVAVVHPGACRPRPTTFCFLCAAARTPNSRCVWS